MKTTVLGKNMDYRWHEDDEVLQDEYSKMSIQTMKILKKCGDGSSIFMILKRMKMLKKLKRMKILLKVTTGNGFLLKRSISLCQVSAI